MFLDLLNQPWRLGTTSESYKIKQFSILTNLTDDQTLQRKHNVNHKMFITFLQKLSNYFSFSLVVIATSVNSLLIQMPPLTLTAMAAIKADAAKAFNALYTKPNFQGSGGCGEVYKSYSGFELCKI